MVKVVGLFLLVASLPFASFAQQKTIERPKEPSAKELKRQRDHATLKIPTGASFYIGPIEQSPNNFSLLLTDADNRNVACNFSMGQLEIFEAVMTEAKKFAESSEGLSKNNAPSITRFVDKKEPSFIVDVEKDGVQSKLYITLNCLTGNITVDAGTIKRDGKEHQTLFANLLSRIQVVKATTPQD